MSSPKIPILLLKTKSLPNDSYKEYFSSATSPFAPVFVPVLEHRPNVHNLQQVKNLLKEGGLKRKYGGMIFTSQRAVEGFAQVVHELEAERSLGKGGKENSMEGCEDRDLDPSMTYSTAVCVRCFLSISIFHTLVLFCSHHSLRFPLCLSPHSSFSNPS